MVSLLTPDEPEFFRTGRQAFPRISVSVLGSEERSAGWFVGDRIIVVVRRVRGGDQVSRPLFPAPAKDPSLPPLSLTSNEHPRPQNLELLYCHIKLRLCTFDLLRAVPFPPIVVRSLRAQGYVIVCRILLITPGADTDHIRTSL